MLITLSEIILLTVGLNIFNKLKQYNFTLSSQPINQQFKILMAKHYFRF